LRPRRIEISGFTCFTKAVEASFEGMDVFAITGRTGSGKTTIMDALCFALYGKVPRGTDPTRLVAHGATKMYVSLEFEAAGVEYRALRRIDVSRTTQKATPTKVQLERRDSSGEWEPLEDRVREMNARIEEIVGLDYRSFTRCVLLPQGRFQEMLAGDPKERREILEELLDIKIYKTIMESANRHARDIEANATAVDRLLASTFADATPEALAERKSELGEKRSALRTARQRRDALQQAAQHASEVRAARSAEKNRRGLAEAKRQELEQAEALAAGGKEQLAALGAELTAADVELRKLKYDRALHTALVMARAKAEETERVAMRAAESEALGGDTRALDAAAKALADAAAAAKRSKSELEAADQALAHGRDEHSAAHLRAGLKPGDLCPVCSGKVGKLPKAAAPALTALERALTAARKAEAEASEAAKAAEIASEREGQKVEQARAQAATLTKELARLRKELAAALPAGMAPDLKTIAAGVDEMDALAGRQDALTKTIDDLRKRRDACEGAVATSAAGIEGLRAEVRSLTDAAAADRSRGDEAIAALSKLVSKWQWGDIDEMIASKRDPSPALGEMLDATQKECDGLERRIGELEGDTKRIERDIKQAEVHRAELEELRGKMRMYATLADLLQANRFRDWYIGEAMGMLASAASERLRTLDPEQRYGLEVRRGEFSVIDGWQAGAERSPDTLSGGETFVVSLALAFALADQLPQIRQASAAQLESLFLDEGFGSLDADTLDPVMSALDGLRSEGRLVGIVTHVQELAERIGTRIEVTKSPTGSTVAIVGAA
jgi:exonuclease SbcC